MEPGTLGLEGRDLPTGPTPPLSFMREQSTEQTKAHAIIRRNGNEFPNFSLGIIEAVSKRLAQIFCQVLWMEDLNRRPVQQFFQAQKVLTLEFFIYKIPNRFSDSSRKQ